MNAPLRDPIVNDVTRLNPVPVFAIARPTTIEEVQKALRETDLPISIGGGHFSMGGQTASPGSLHLDMRAMNRILAFSPVDGTVRVEAGVRWCDLQRFLDPHDRPDRRCAVAADGALACGQGMEIPTALFAAYMRSGARWRTRHIDCCPQSRASLRFRAPETRLAYRASRARRGWNARIATSAGPSLRAWGGSSSSVDTRF